MNELEKIEDEIVKSNTLLLFKKMKSLKALTINLNNKHAIVIDKNKFNNSNETRTALIHEQMHIQENALYDLNDSIRTRQRREYKANKAMVLKYVPIDKLKSLINANSLLNEIADSFNVTESTIILAIKIYKNMEVL